MGCAGLALPDTPQLVAILHNGQLRPWLALAFAAQPVRRDGPHWVTKHLHINSHLISAGFLQLSHAHPLLPGSDSSRCAILYSQYRLCDYRQIKTVAISDLSVLAETHNTDDRVIPAKPQAVGHDLVAESATSISTAGYRDPHIRQFTSGDIWNLTRF